MTTARTLPMFLASLMGLVVMSSVVKAQTAGGADRYLGATQQSIARTNGMISSMTRAGVPTGVGGLGMTGAIQSVNRTKAMIDSMNANRAATMRGMQQQVVHRTPDNLYGVYWNLQVMREAQLYHILELRGLREFWAFPNVNAPGGLTDRQRMTRGMQLQANHARQRARSAELSHRAQQRVQPSSPHEPAPRFDTNQSVYSQAHRLNQDITITAPSPVPQNLPRR